MTIREIYEMAEKNGMLDKELVVRTYAEYFDDVIMVETKFAADTVMEECNDGLAVVMEQTYIGGAESIDPECIDDFTTLVENGDYAPSKAFEICANGNYHHYYNCCTYEQLGHAVAEYHHLLDNVPENMKEYIDYKQIGLDMRYNNNFVDVCYGEYIEVLESEV